MRTSILFIALLFFIRSEIQAQIFNFPNYRSNEEMSPDFISPLAYAKSIEYSVTESDTIKCQENYYDRGLISRRVYFVNSKIGLLRNREVLYEWKNKSIHKIIVIDDKNDTVTYIDECNFPVLKSFVENRGEKKLITVREYNSRIQYRLLFGAGKKV